MIGNNLWKVATVIGMAVILFIGLFWGWNTGKIRAQTQTVLANEQALEKALENFYNDQNRYPTAGEFSDPNILGVYVQGSYPVADIQTKVCSQSFLYRRISFTTYQLNYCLPNASGNFPAGWNKKTVTK